MLFRASGGESKLPNAAQAVEYRLAGTENAVWRAPTGADRKKNCQSAEKYVMLALGFRWQQSQA
jgi:hypothetical protein